MEPIRFGKTLQTTPQITITQLSLEDQGEPEDSVLVESRRNSCTSCHSKKLSIVSIHSYGEISEGPEQQEESDRSNPLEQTQGPKQY